MSGNTAEPKKQKPVSAWQLIAIGVVVVLFLLMLTWPNRVEDEVRQRQLRCINNLRQIDAAKQEWALEIKAASNAIPTWDNLKRYLGTGTGDIIPKCPDGGIYTIGSVEVAPTCSIKGHALDH